MHRIRIRGPCSETGSGSRQKHRIRLVPKPLDRGRFALKDSKKCLSVGLCEEEILSSRGDDQHLTNNFIDNQPAISQRYGLCTASHQSKVQSVYSQLSGKGAVCVQPAISQMYGLCTASYQSKVRSVYSQLSVKGTVCVQQPAISQRYGLCTASYQSKVRSAQLTNSRRYGLYSPLLVKGTD